VIRGAAARLGEAAVAGAAVPGTGTPAAAASPGVVPVCCCAHWRQIESSA